MTTTASTAGCGRSPRRVASRPDFCPRPHQWPLRNSKSAVACVVVRGSSNGPGSKWTQTNASRSAFAGRAPRGPRRASGPIPTAGPRSDRPGEGRNESGFQPFSLLVKRSAGVVDVHILDDLAERPPQDHPGHETHNRQDAGSRSAIPWSMPPPTSLNWQAISSL